MLKYQHLVGLEFSMENRNCYTLLRDFYRDNYGIELTDYPCPTNWFSKGLDLYGPRLWEAEGFYQLNCHPRDWRPGDVILCAIQSSTGSHVCILLEDGKILHHLVGQRSTVTSYGGIFRNTTIGVYRHKLVDTKVPVEETVDFRSLLAPHARKKLEELEARQQTQEETRPGS